MRCRGIYFFLAAASLLCGLTAFAQEQIQYKVKIEGAGPIGSTLEEASSLVALQDRPPETAELLESRVARDVPRLMQFLKAEGYYGASIRPTINSEAKPVLVTLNVELGPQFRVSSVSVETEGGAEAARGRMPEAGKLELDTGSPVRAKAILAARERLLRIMRERGLAYAKVPAPDVTVDHTTQEASVVFRVEPGPVSQFGRITVTGNEDVETSFIRQKASWSLGDIYSQKQVEELRKRLRESGLFSLVQVTIPEEAPEDDSVPVTIKVAERKPRTISAGVSYATDEGAGVRTSWEHRNFSGRGERLHLDAIVSDQQDAFEALYTIPDWERPRQTLELKGRVALDDTDAYESRNVSLAASVNRELSKRLVVGLGVQLKAADVDQLGENIQSLLVSLPGFLTYDTSDDLLNPANGGRLRLELAPFHDFAQNVSFGRAKTTYAHYFLLKEDPRLVFASRLTLGVIAGADWEDIPPDERFYAGGGGSVRGYPYQKVGPLCGDTPLGGRSLMEVSGELRYRINERFGLVTFLDGGTASRSAYPDFNEDFLWGAGIGGRYFSPLGPIRLDVAVPLNKRSGVDDSFQIYVSLGQAF